MNVTAPTEPMAFAVRREICASLNHLCQVNGTTATFYRGACSMPGDTNSTCATICTDSDSGSNLSGGRPVGQYPGLSDEFYCDTDKAANSNCTSFASSTQVYTLSGEFLGEFFCERSKADDGLPPRRKLPRGVQYGWECHRADCLAHLLSRVGGNDVSRGGG